jgi:3-oxoacyl-[acyl-carrier protein] reductase
MKKCVTLITGANGGVGQHIARFLLESGETNIVCHYRNDRDKVDDLLREFGIDPMRHAIQSELTSESSVERMANTLRENFGGINRLVNVAGSSTNGMHWKLTANDFSQVINDSLLSTFLCCKAFSPEMRESRYGRIVNISSIVGFTGIAGASHYAAAKAGLVGFTKSIALELASRNITANALALGYFDSGLIDSVPESTQAMLKERIPAGRFGGKNDIGAAVNYLLCDDASFVTGQIIHLNGGQF